MGASVQRLERYGWLLNTESKIKAIKAKPIKPQNTSHHPVIKIHIHHNEASKSGVPIGTQATRQSRANIRLGENSERLWSCQPGVDTQQNIQVQQRTQEHKPNTKQRHHPR